MSDLRAGGTAPHNPFTDSTTGLLAVLLLAGVISVFNSHPVRVSLAILALGFIGGIVAGVM